MGILNVDNIQPVGGGTTITLNSSEINVGTGVTFESNGQANFAGIVTATSFVGSGANLTGLTASFFEKTDVGINTISKVGIGTTNPTAKLEIKGSNNPLVKIVQDTSGIARLNLESETNDGYQYSGIGLGDGTNDAELMWTTGGFDINVGNAVRLRINSSGAWGAGTNFGSSGQVLTSQGSGSPVQWASAPTWTQQSISTVQSGTEHEMTGIPSNAREIMIRFDGISPNGSGALMFVLGNSGGYSTSGYIISAGYHPNENYVKRTDSIKFHGVNSANYIVTGRVHLWYPIHSNNWWVEGVAFPDENEGRYQHRVTGNANAGGTLTKIKMTLDNSASFDSTGNGKVQLSYLTY